MVKCKLVLDESALSTLHRGGEGQNVYRMIFFPTLVTKVEVYQLVIYIAKLNSIFDVISGHFYTCTRSLRTSDLTTGLFTEQRVQLPSPEISLI